MSRPRRPQLFTIPAHRAFADALATGLIDRFGDDRLELARGMVLLPNHRAVRALTDAFVRASGGGLLLPRMVPIGEAELDEGIGAALDPADAEPAVPPAIAPLARRLILARLVGEARARAGQPVDAAEAVRLAGELARTLDQLLVEEIAPIRLKQITMTQELSAHWERALAVFELVLRDWPAELARLGRIDLATRRTLLLGALAQRWRKAPPPGFVCAAGVTSAAPAIARLLRVVSELPRGMIVLPALSTAMDEAEWDALGPHPRDPATGQSERAIETHPQFHLKQLIERMGVARGEVMRWPGEPAEGPGARRLRAVEAAMAPAAFTAKWTALSRPARRLEGVRTIELASPAEEAQAIALALRQALEVPGRTAALVTPDRALARRVAAHLGRWGITIDDSAGRPLAILAPGVLLLALAEAAAQRFAPLALLALLKHPLVASGEGRLAWLDGVRALDLALRGPRPPAGLAGIDSALAAGPARQAIVRAVAARWWPEARALLAPVEAMFAAGPAPLGQLIAALRDGAEALCGQALWAGPAGRAAADLLAALDAESDYGPGLVEPASLAPMLRTLMDEVAVRPPQGGHPRLAIYGLIEARLQSADLVVLAGLNEGVWPGQPAPDPWLAPRIRMELGLATTERMIGVAAHDLVNGMGAGDVLLTRARRDATSLTIASRFWLRLQAMSGGLERDHALEHWARQIDDPGDFDPAGRPRPSPPVAARPRRLAVTDLDRLKADPYAFYAARMLKLAPLDPVDAEPSAAWRGTAIHKILEDWAKEDGGDTARLVPRARALMADGLTHPLLRALWQPRLLEAIDFIAARIAEQQAQGRRVIAAERHGRIEIAGITLSGTFDRIDRLADGSLAIVDYKSGKPPSVAAVREGFSLQLGLLGLIAERGGFEGIEGAVRAFEYWSLAKHNGQFGRISTPVEKGTEPGDFTARAAANLEGVVGEFLTGSAPFTARLNPEYAPYADYDQLMRLDEWLGRD